MVSGSAGDSGEVLEGGWQTTVRRVGDVIHRSAGPWSPSVIAFLGHLGEVGFSGSPRPVGAGFDEGGNEVLTFIEGDSPHPYPWSDEAIGGVGAMLAEFHAAARSFQPPADAVWKERHSQSLGDSRRGFGHGDLGPWNIIAVDGKPVGFIDWDTAGPMDPIWELAEVGWLNAQLHDDDVAERIGLGDANARALQLKLLLDSYGLPTADRSGFVDKMIEFAVHDARNEAVEHHVGPDTTSGVADDGYPFAWGIAWRVRDASWMLRNRCVLETTICT